MVKLFKYLFNWDEIPGKDTERFIEYLIHNYGVNWVRIAKIEKSESSLNVFTENNSLSLRLNNEKTKAILEIDGSKVQEFVLKMETGKLKIYLVEKKMTRRNLIIIEGIIIAIAFSLIFLISTIAFGYIQKSINNDYIILTILIILLFIAMFSFKKSERYDEYRARTNMFKYEERFGKNLPEPIRSIFYLRYYPFFRAMNAEENRKLAIEKNFYSKLRDTNIELERLTFAL